MTEQDRASSLPDTLSPLRWGPLGLELLDQTRLPSEEVWILCERPEQVADAIRRLAIRGAPAIGVAAAYGLVLGLRDLGDGGEEGAPTDPALLDQRFDEVFALLAATRPTAVNLRWALAAGRRVFVEHRTAEALLAWAQALHAEDVAINRRMGEHGAQLFLEGDRVLTHCNTGALATAGYGTALGVIQSSFRQGKLGMVWVDETRPLLQGARLTAWELERLGIPFRLITDSSAGALMARGLVDRIVVGADRIAANGDAANKIGTYTVAVLAHRHGIPFYVAAPLSTIDRETLTGADIPIEEREAHEVTELRGMPVAPAGTKALNFAFDVTPSELIAGIITEVGVLTAPYTESIAKAFAAGGEETDR
jgi:methylthioribose-1-phosphate isomerase